jgi:hypothetical protein
VSTEWNGKSIREWRTTSPVTCPSTSHYSFVDWDTAAKGSGANYDPADTFTMPAHDVTLYAQWALQTYNIYYYGMNRNLSSTATYNITSGAITLPILGDIGGYNRIGWVDGQDPTQDPWLGIYMPDNLVTSIPNGSTGDRYFYAWYAANPIITSVRFMNGSGGWDNKMDVGDYVEVTLSAPLGTGCSPQLVRFDASSFWRSIGGYQYNTAPSS